MNINTHYSYKLKNHILAKFSFIFIILFTCLTFSNKSFSETAKTYMLPGGQLKIITNASFNRVFVYFYKMDISYSPSITIEISDPNENFKDLFEEKKCWVDKNIDTNKLDPSVVNKLVVLGNYNVCPETRKHINYKKLDNGHEQITYYPDDPDYSHTIILNVLDISEPISISTKTLEVYAVSITDYFEGKKYFSDHIIFKYNNFNYYITLDYGESTPSEPERKLIIKAFLNSIYPVSTNDKDFFYF